MLQLTRKRVLYVVLTLRLFCSFPPLFALIAWSAQTECWKVPKYNSSWDASFDFRRRKSVLFLLLEFESLGLQQLQ